MNFEELQKSINIFFHDPQLLATALTHPSYLAEHPEEEDHNQRLEFLGCHFGFCCCLLSLSEFPRSSEEI